MNMMDGYDHWDEIMAFMKGKGKRGGCGPKGKSKNKNNHFVQQLEDVMAIVKGKGKHRPAMSSGNVVNTYAMNTMEMMTVEDMGFMMDKNNILDLESKAGIIENKTLRCCHCQRPMAREDGRCGVPESQLSVIKFW